MWPDHIDLPVNDWIFTKDQIKASPTAVGARYTKDMEENLIQRGMDVIRSMPGRSHVMFQASVYLRRYYLRASLQDSIVNDTTAIVCYFLAARTLEFHYKVEVLIKAFVERYLKKNMTNKELYSYKDIFLKQEVNIMEKLCCDFIIYEPFRDYETNLMHENRSNPYEMDKSDNDVNHFWSVVRSAPATVPHQPPQQPYFYVDFKNRLLRLVRSELSLLFPLETITIAILIYNAAKYNIHFPKDFFNTRDINITWEALHKVFEYVTTLPSSSGHPEINILMNTLKNNTDVLGDATSDLINTINTTDDNNNGNLSTRISSQDESTLVSVPGTPDVRPSRPESSNAGNASIRSASMTPNPHNNTSTNTTNLQHRKTPVSHITAVQQSTTTTPSSQRYGNGVSSPVMPIPALGMAHQTGGVGHLMPTIPQKKIKTEMKNDTHEKEMESANTSEETATKKVETEKLEDSVEKNVEKKTEDQRKKVIEAKVATPKKKTSSMGFMMNMLNRKTNTLPTTVTDKPKKVITSPKKDITVPVVSNVKTPTGITKQNGQSKTAETKDEEENKRTPQQKRGSSALDITTTKTSSSFSSKNNVQLQPETQDKTPASKKRKANAGTNESVDPVAHLGPYDQTTAMSVLDKISDSEITDCEAE